MKIYGQKGWHELGKSTHIATMNWKNKQGYCPYRKQHPTQHLAKKNSSQPNSFLGGGYEPMWALESWHFPASNMLIWTVCNIWVKKKNRGKSSCRIPLFSSILNCFFAPRGPQPLPGYWSPHQSLSTPPPPKTSAMCTKFQHKKKESLSLGRAIPFDATLRFWMKGQNCWKDCTLKNIRLKNCGKKPQCKMPSHLPNFRFVESFRVFSFSWRKPPLGFQRPTWDVKIPLVTKRDIYHINRWDGFPNHQQYGKIWVLMKLMRHFLKCSIRIQKP